MAHFNLQKSVEKARFVIDKRKLPNIKAQVLMNLDVSGSARNLFQQGLIQDAFQRVLPIGILFDDNGEIDVFTFADGNSIAHVQPPATKENYDGYIQKNILNNRNVPLWGGTDYAPVIKENLESMGFYKTTKGGFFSKGKTVLESTSSSGMPSIVYFFTDGANSDRGETTRILQECQDAKAQMYFLFIAIGEAGESTFDYIRRLGDKFDNTGFLRLKDLAKIDDDSIYEQLLPDELCTWLKASR